MNVFGAAGQAFLTGRGGNPPLRARDVRRSEDARRRVLGSSRAPGSHRRHDVVTQPLADGRHDAIVLWAERRDDAFAMECTITSGAHRGQVVAIVSRVGAPADELALVGLPCTLVVAGDDIRVEMG
jgi:hypothetical protein